MKTFLAWMILAVPCIGWGQEPIEVSVEGPTAVAFGGFALVGHGPEGAVLRWRVETPEGAASPLELVNSGGDPVLVFLATSPGRYGVVLTGQVPVEGLDPWAEATHPVTVGTLPPGPTPVPPGPTPPVPPDLTGISKAVYDVAKTVDKAIVAKAANAYGSQVSAINAGAYNADEIEAAKQKIVSSINAENPPRESAVALFDAIDGELQKLEEADKLTTLKAVSDALAQITKGLEAVQ